MPYGELNGIRMYYEEVGSGPPLVLLHGASGSIDQPVSGWGGLVGRFRRTHRCIQVEHRGHGRTDNPAGTLTYAQVAGDIAALITSLSLAPAHVAGVSDGGIVALHLGMHHRDRIRSLVCVGANYRNDRLAIEANRFCEPAVVDGFTPEEVAKLAGYHDRNKWPGYWRDLYRQISVNLAVNPDYTVADLGRIEAPTLLIAGEEDPWGNVDQMTEMRRSIPNAEMLIINHAGHVVQYTHPDIVGPAVLNFLQRVEGLIEADPLN